MIGQENILYTIEKWSSNNYLPRFMLITGQRGQGKKLLANVISSKYNIPLIPIDTKVDSIREMINLAYEQTEPIIYLIADADKMSLNAKNSLLKVIEEPPNNAIFIMTLKTAENTLATIKSRCFEFTMDNYTDDDLNSFINMLDNNISEAERDILIGCCNNFVDIELFNKYVITEFYEYVQKVYSNIYKVQSANSFKIAEKLAMKNEEDKYDIELFLQTFRYLAYKNLTELMFDNSNISKSS